MVYVAVPFVLSPGASVVLSSVTGAALSSVTVSPVTATFPVLVTLYVYVITSPIAEYVEGVASFVIVRAGFHSPVTVAVAGSDLTSWLSSYFPAAYAEFVTDPFSISS
jgi:hypothetical protein